MAAGGAAREARQLAGLAAPCCAEGTASEAEATSPLTRAAAAPPGGRAAFAALTLLAACAVAALSVAAFRAAAGGGPRGGAALRLGGADAVLQRSTAHAAAPQPTAHAAAAAAAATEGREHLGPWQLPLQELTRRELIERVQAMQAAQAGHGAAVAAASDGHAGAPAPPERGALVAAPGEEAKTNTTDGGGVANATACGRKCLVGFLAKAFLNKSMTRCASGEESCISSRCCVGRGLQCYAKNATHGRCKPDCVPGPDPTDEDDGLWSCNSIGIRTPGQPVQCSKPGENCISSECCETPGTTCFAKNGSFASCKAACRHGVPDQSDEDPSPWSCKALGKKAKGAAAWVEGWCSKGYQECSATRCCSEPGMQCFEKDPYWAQCLPNCTADFGAGPGWSCKALGEISPAKEDSAPAKGPSGGKVAPWVEQTCSGALQDCSGTQCCKQPGYQCYLKNEYWGMCREGCTSGTDAYDNETWSCKEVGPRSWGLATQGWPGLYCWALVRTKGYEKVIIRMQAEARAGIFACDGHAIVADGEMSRLDQTTHLHIEVNTDFVGVSSDGTAANTLLFIEAWRAVIQRGDFDFYDWTLKVDPDAVMLPDRVRTHLLPYTGLGEGKHYVLNCNAYPERPDFPMMYGALEAFSRKAVQQYAWGHNKSCVNGFHWQDWGEDVFMVSCMNSLGISKLSDMKLIGDNNCIGNGHQGADCNNDQLAAFHPFKDIRSWSACFQAATGHLLEVSVQDEVEQWS